MKRKTNQTGGTEPRYALRKRLGYWELTFEGQKAILKHEQGISYVAYLLLNPPPEPIHALDLATRIAASDRKQAFLPEIVDPVTGRRLQLERDARIQERSLGLDNAQVMRATLRRQHELEALLEDEDTIEPVKEEVQRDLIELYRYEEQNTARTRDSAQRCVRAVRMAIKRFYDHLAGSTDPEELQSRLFADSQPTSKSTCSFPHPDTRVVAWPLRELVWQVASPMNHREELLGQIIDYSPPSGTNPGLRSSTTLNCRQSPALTYWARFIGKGSGGRSLAVPAAPSSSSGQAP